MYWLKFSFSKNYICIQNHYFKEQMSTNAIVLYLLIMRTQFLACIADVFFPFPGREIKQGSEHVDKKWGGGGEKGFFSCLHPSLCSFLFCLQFHSLHMSSSKNLLCRLLKFWSVMKFDTSLLTQPKFHNPSVSVLTGLHCIILTLQLQSILTCFPSLLATLPFYRLHEGFFTL